MSKREHACWSSWVLTSPQEAGLLLELNLVLPWFAFIAEPLILLTNLGGVPPEPCDGTWHLGGRRIGVGCLQRYRVAVKSQVFQRL